MTEDRFGIVGKVIARTYKIRDVVAEGGFGVVYRAYHQGFRAEVALKCLKIPNELTDEQRQSFLEQFRSEAEVLFRLSAQNPHIVRPLHVDAFHTPNQKLVPFMALEWLEGRTLDGLVSERRKRGKKPLNLQRLTRLLTPVAEALEQAHHFPGKDGVETVVHRDMKPENLFIARVGDAEIAKILDFGISKVKSTAGHMAGRASVNADLLVSFSPAYGAPEQWAPRSYGQTGRWTDVWGLSLSMVEVIKGEDVIVGDQAAMMGTILDPNRRPTPRSEGVLVSDAVEQVFQRALAVDPRDRYQTVGEFWDDLTHALGMRRELDRISIRHVKRHVGYATTGVDSAPPSADPRFELDVLPPIQRAPTSLERQRDPGALPWDVGSFDSGFAGSPGSGNYASHAGPHGLGAPYGTDVRPLSLPSSPRPYVARTTSSPPRSGAGTWLRALSPSLALLALSLAVTLLDRAVAHSRGTPLSFGPVQASWVAAGFMVLALATGASAVKRALTD